MASKEKQTELYNFVSWVVVFINVALFLIGGVILEWYSDNFYIEETVVWLEMGFIITIFEGIIVNLIVNCILGKE